MRRIPAIRPILAVAFALGLGAGGRGSAEAAVARFTGGPIVVEQNAGNTTAPEPGGYYRDNAVVAWATIYANGAVCQDFGVASVEKVGTGRYKVTLDNPCVDYAAVVAFRATFAKSLEEMDRRRADRVPLTEPIVFMEKVDGRHTWSTIDWGEDTDFSVIVLGRPQL